MTQHLHRGADAPGAFLAHSPPQGWGTDPAAARQAGHPLQDHLAAVSTLAARMAADWGAEWARLAGLWHDLGKFRPGFQAYLRQTPDAPIEARLPTRSEKTHSAAGALHALQVFEQRWGAAGALVARVLAGVIGGHHAGLPDWHAGLDERLLGPAADHSRREYDEALQACRAASPDLLALPAGFDLRTLLPAVPGVRGTNPLAWALWARMLFSAVVDADFLDTEAFMDPARAQQRSGHPDLGHYGDLLSRHLTELHAQVQAQGRANDAVMRLRAQVLQQCRDKAGTAPGVFTLAVPTGGGKTLTSLAFALDHARAHGLRRVVYAIPYTSIVEQTGDVLAAVFGRDAVLEHHSQADGGGAGETVRSRLACENWDAPLVVTTTVQLFESLFAARPSRCRKLHHIAGSVIVLDEAQLLPPPFLQPILDTLSLLVAHYRVTVLLCTATQPHLGDQARFDARLSVRGLPPATRLIDDEAALYRQLDRVHFEWPADPATDTPLSEVAEQLAQADCALAIVNTRADAAELAAALAARTGEPVLHLSAAMCGQHRADVIALIRQRLAARGAGTDTRPLRVVSTQLVEAGVDLDFPVVFRALAGLDSIAQAAGRCNREGRLAHGRVVVFVRPIPRGLAPIRYGAEATRSLLSQGLPATLTPELFQRYFESYHAKFSSLDARGIVDDLRNRGDFDMAFATAACKFRLIDDEDQASLIVPYCSATPSAADPAPLISRLKRGETDRWLLRDLQRSIVTVRQPLIDRWLALGDVQALQPGLYLLTDPLRYDAQLGLLPDGSPLDAASLVA